MSGLRGYDAGVTDMLFGDGSDGAVILSADTVLTRDMCYEHLTINPGVKVISAGFTIRVRETCTIGFAPGNPGVVMNNGFNARSSNGSASEVSSSVPAGTPGGLGGSLPAGGRGGAGMYNGGAPSGSLLHDAGIQPLVSSTLVPPVDISSFPVYGLGGQGGRGGDVQAFVTGAFTSVFGATGSSGTIQPQSGSLHSFFSLFAMGTIGTPQTNKGTFYKFAGGGGGGAGACLNSGSIGVKPRSGWGGGGGGCVYISARELRFQGEVRAMGGAGGNTFSAAAGGGGGGGGLVFLVYSSLLLRNSFRNQINVNGGAPGVGYLSGSGNVTPLAPASGGLGQFFTFGV